jgi:hypothetical protein
MEKRMGLVYSEEKKLQVNKEKNLLCGFAAPVCSGIIVQQHLSSNIH